MKTGPTETHNLAGRLCGWSWIYDRAWTMSISAAPMYQLNQLKVHTHTLPYQQPVHCEPTKWEHNPDSSLIRFFWQSLPESIRKMRNRRGKKTIGGKWTYARSMLPQNKWKLWPNIQPWPEKWMKSHPFETRAQSQHRKITQEMRNDIKTQERKDKPITET